MAPYGRGVCIHLRVVDGRAAVRCCTRGAAHEDGDSGIKPGDGVELVCQGADSFCIGVLVDDLHRVPFLGLFNRVMGRTCGHMRYT